MLEFVEQVMDVPLIVLPDMNQADIDRAWEEYCLRQSALDEFYSGIRGGHWDAGHVEMLMDMLEFQEIDPLEFADTVIQNVESVLSGVVPVAADVVG